MTWRRDTAFVAALLVLGGCTRQDERFAVPAPLEITDEAVGHYCGMSLMEHAGPKGQIFIGGRKDPYWFSSVRETFAFTKLPEEPRNIIAIYVNDMAKARNWDRPEPGTWIDAKRAWFVIESRRRGGMDVGEAVPFGEETKAEGFVAENGGRVVRFDEVPNGYVFPSADAPGKTNSKHED
jgi:copper chaperone NosL